MNVWFTSDLHFGHNGIISYCERPFSSVEEMDSELIRRWNEKVKPEDIIYIIGDFSFCGLIRTREILKQLNGRKILIKGNHDKHFFRKNGEIKDDLDFAEYYENTKLMLSSGDVIVMSHYPYKGIDDLEGRDFSHKQVEDVGGFLIHGHVHRGWKIKGRMINVGSDVWDYAPISEEQIINIIKG